LGTAISPDCTMMISLMGLLFFCQTFGNCSTLHNNPGPLVHRLCMWETSKVTDRVAR
jgi:hypothetical protein